MSYSIAVKTLTVRLPEQLVAEIEAESRRRNVAKSDVVRERLQTPYGAKTPTKTVSTMDLIADLVGSVEGLPPDLSARKKYYLKKWGYGKDGPDRRRISRRPV